MLVMPGVGGWDTHGNNLQTLRRPLRVNPENCAVSHVPVRGSAVCKTLPLGRLAAHSVPHGISGLHNLGVERGLERSSLLVCGGCGLSSSQRDLQGQPYQRC